MTVTCLTEVNLKDLRDHGIDLVITSPEFSDQSDRVDISDLKFRDGRDTDYRVMERFELIVSFLLS